MIRNIITFLFFLILCHQVNFGSEKTSATVRLQPKQITIGQPAELHIRASVPSDGVLIWPGVEQLKGQKIEILTHGSIDTLFFDTEKTSIQQINRITAWQEGYIPIPPLEFIFITENDTTHFESKAQLFDVQGVEVDMQEMYQDIRPLFAFPRTFREFLPYLLTIIGLLLVMFLLLRFLKRRKKPLKEPTIWEKPEVPAHIAAISSLETLKQKELWQKGHIKDYHSELATILRKYLYKRFHLDAMEMTTREIIHQLPVYVEDITNQNKLKMIFELADMVKFAKFLPNADDHTLALEKSLDFVKNTAQIENNKE